MTDIQFGNEYDAEKMRKYVHEVETELRSAKARLSTLKPSFVRNLDSADATTYTLLKNDDDTLIVDCTTAAFTASLPAGLGTADAGKTYTTGKIDAANSLTTDGNGANINGAPTHTNSTQWKRNVFQWTGTEWMVNP